MDIIKSPQKMLELADNFRRDGKRIGFVPTLGNLHQGHAKLIETIKDRCDVVVVSIFVNPVQFGASEDLANYPRSEEEDLIICKEQGAGIVFLPQAEDIYAEGKHPRTQVNIPTISPLHCGISRPNHFMGVLTIVSLLFNLVKPACSTFGKKDFQQLRMIEIMTKELHFPVEIIPVDTGRAEDGLALSSRNRYLTPEERVLAPRFYKCLCSVADKIRAGGKDFRVLEQNAVAQLAEEGFKNDYVHIALQDNLREANAGDKGVVVLGAVYLGKARLIDNVILD